MAQDYDSEIDDFIVWYGKRLHNMAKITPNPKLLDKDEDNLTPEPHTQGKDSQ